uniref:Uncharacterized protein n=1 Tax=Aegilops tauschii subsp. strangulata TaxID=200361 RepID=A0A453CBN9_AEGTS
MEKIESFVGSKTVIHVFIDALSRLQLVPPFAVYLVIIWQSMLVCLVCDQYLWLMYSFRLCLVAICMCFFSEFIAISSVLICAGCRIT